MELRSAFRAALSFIRIDEAEDCPPFCRKQNGGAASAITKGGMRSYVVLILLVLSMFVNLGCASIRHPHIPHYERETLEQLNLAKQEIHAGNQADAIKVGTAKVDITPPVGTSLAGFGRRKGRPSTGVRDPLFARVIV